MEMLDYKQKGEQPGGCVPFRKIADYKLLALVVVAVGLTLMSRMVMVVRPMLPGVLMIVHFCAALVGMIMAVLVQMLMSVIVGVFVGVLFASVSMLMAVFVSVLVSVQMPMFVFSFHCNDSFPGVYGSSMDPLMLTPIINL
jgi:hypothetical protein